MGETTALRPAEVKAQDEIARDWLRWAEARDRAELRMWRDQYPHLAAGMREAAEAQVEGREPRKLQPTIIG